MTEIKSPLAPALSNTLMIPVCILLLLWFLKATKRFVRTITMRTHFLRGGGSSSTNSSLDSSTMGSSNDMIEIQGLGSYLMYFDEISRIHTSSMVHTRQTKPAMVMNTNFIPISLQSLRFLPNTPSAAGSPSHRSSSASSSSSASPSSVLEVSLSTSISGKLLLLPHFEVNHFKQAIQQGVASSNVPRTSSSHKASSSSSSSSSSSGFGEQGSASVNKTMIQWIRKTIFHVEGSGSSSSPSTSGTVSRHDTPWLVARECCHSHILSADIVCGTPTTRTHTTTTTVQFDVSSLLTMDSRTNSQGVGSRSRSGSHGTPQSLLRFRGNTSNNNGVITDAGVEAGPAGGGVNASASPISASSASSAKQGMFDFALVFIPTIAPREMVIVSQATKKVAVPQSLMNPQQSQGQGQSDADYEDREAGMMVHTTSTNEHMMNETTTRPSESWLSMVVPRWMRVSQSDTNRASLSRSSSSLDPNQIEVRSSRDREELTSQVMEIAIATMFTLQLPMLTSAATTTIVATEANPVHTSTGTTASPSSSVAATVASVKNLYPKDLFFIDHRGQLLHSLEIFGLNPVTSTDTSSAANTSDAAGHTASASAEHDILTGGALYASKPSSGGSPGNTSRIAPVDTEKAYHQSLPFPQDRSLAGSSVAPAPETASSNTPAAAGAASGLLISQGGKFPKDECVICLTELREIMLLPCRHLCVCNSCLVYVDKCPVCRAQFEEYVLIQSKQELCFPSPSELHHR